MAKLPKLLVVPDTNAVLPLSATSTLLSRSFLDELQKLRAVADVTVSVPFVVEQELLFRRAEALRSLLKVGKDLSRMLSANT